jgi:DNA repair protein RadC
MFVREITRVYKQTTIPADGRRRIEFAEDAIALVTGVPMLQLMTDQPKEKFIALYLDIQNKILGYEVIGIGSISVAIVCSRYWSLMYEKSNTCV